MQCFRALTSVLAVVFLIGCTGTSGPRQPAEPVDQRPPPPPGVFRYEVFGVEYETIPSSLGYLEIGVASWYGKKFHGRLTSNGETYDMYQVSAAHKTLPLPTWVRVTNLDNGKKVVLRINDRGPFHDDRLIDLSYKAAVELGYDKQGTAPVVVEAIDELNYPELVKKPEPAGPRYYLQVGAYSTRQNAENFAVRVRAALGERVTNDRVKVLDIENESRVLFKVWIGPIADFESEQDIEHLLADQGFGTPIRVTVD